MKIELGKYTDLSNADYHADTNSISRSAIMNFANSPKKYWANYLNEFRPEKKTTAPMLFGEAFHTLILEPARFSTEYCINPTLHKLPKVGLLRDLGREEFDRQKADRANVSKLNEIIQREIDENLETKKCISGDDYQRLLDMQSALKANPEAYDLISAGENEASYFWKDESGLTVKARPDCVQGSIVIDLKTCADASPKAFQRAMCDGGYHIQAAMILDALKAVENKDVVSFACIAVESVYPFSTVVYLIDPAAIEAGRIKYKSVLVDMKLAQEQNSYCDYATQFIGLPSWYE